MSKLDLTIKTDAPERLVTFVIGSPVVVGRQVRSDEPVFMERPHRELEQRHAVTLFSEEVLWLGEKTDAQGVVLQPCQPILELAVRQSDDAWNELRPEDDLRHQDVRDCFGRILADGVLGILQADATDEDFFERTASVLLEILDLDVAQILFYDSGVWTPRAGLAAPTQQGRPFRNPNRTLLQKVLENKRTFWWGGGPGYNAIPMSEIVASPISSRNGEVLGALYGERWRTAITRLEATLVELFAQVIAVRLARVE